MQPQERKGKQTRQKFRRLELRSKPIQALSKDAVVIMVTSGGFFDSSFNKEGMGIKHQYVLIERLKEKLVTDYATGLIWQQSGSPEFMPYAQAPSYVHELNHKRFAGYHGWRLPTLEEAVSLLSPRHRNGSHANPVFDRQQWRIWTADHASDEVAWLVHFVTGDCDELWVKHPAFVRAVRTI